MYSDCIKATYFFQEPWNLVASFPDEFEIYSKDNEKPTKEY